MYDMYTYMEIKFTFYDKTWNFFSAFLPPLPLLCIVYLHYAPKNPPLETVWVFSPNIFDPQLVEFKNVES